MLSDGKADYVRLPLKKRESLGIIGNCMVGYSAIVDQFIFHIAECGQNIIPDDGYILKLLYVGIFGTVIGVCSGVVTN